MLLPLVELIIHTQMALDELIDLTGWAAIEALLSTEKRTRRIMDYRQLVKSAE